MREILFKAKRIDNGEWVEGFYFCMVHEDGRHVHHFIMPIGVDVNLGTPIEKIQVEIDIDTLCQYTGLEAYWTAFENEPQECDVWEHDLLEVDYEGKKVIANVKYEGGMFILASNEFIDSYIPLFNVVQIEDDYWIDAEHIGNIFDNPELLEGGADDGKES